MTVHTKQFDEMCEKVISKWPGVSLALAGEIADFALNQQEYLRWCLEQLEIATTNFFLSGLKYMTTLPKQEFELLLPALTNTRALLGKQPRTEMYPVLEGTDEETD